MDKLRIKIKERRGVYIATLQIRTSDDDWRDLEDFVGRSDYRSGAINELTQDVYRYINFLTRNFLGNDDITVVDENGGRLEDYEL